MNTAADDVFAAEAEAGGQYDSYTANERLRLVYARAGENLATYIRVMYPLYERRRHLNEVNRILHRVESGESGYDRVIICIPPRHGKSLTCTEHFPAWYLGRNPTHQVILAAAQQSLADKFGRRVRNLLRSPIHRAIFPECELSSDAKAVRQFTTTRGGVCIAVGRGAMATGFGGHLIMLDDPLKDKKEAGSEVILQGLYEWFDATIYSRLMPQSRIVLVTTRWCDADLAGYLLREHADDGWKLVRMPAIAEENEFDDKGDLVREAGEALWPEGYPVSRPAGEPGHSLERIQKTLSPMDWQCIYQQRPGFVEGNVFNERWLLDNTYEKDPREIRRGMNVVVLGDPATGKTTEGRLGKRRDYTALVTVGLAKDRHIYILDIVRDRLELRARWKALKRQHQRWRPYYVWYEDYGTTTDGQYFKERMEEESYHFTFGAPKNRGRRNLKKEDRIRKLEPWFADGRIHFPKAMWRETDGVDKDLVEVFLEEEYKPFPAGLRDDMFDALARILDEELPLEWPLDDEEAEEDEDSGGATSWMAE